MKNKIILTTLISIMGIAFFNTVYAETAIHLNIETSDSSVYNEEITILPCDSDGDVNTPDTITAYCALVQSGVTSDWSGLWINSINGLLNNDNNNGAYWMWLANLNTDNTNPSSSYNLSAKQYILNPNDRILFYYNTNPLDISVDNTNPEVGENIKITIKELGLDSLWNPVWNKAIGGKIIIGTESFDLDVDGSYSLTILNTNEFTIKGQKSGLIDSRELTITPTIPLDTIPPTITLIGENSLSIYVGDNYTDLGATANDDIDGDITSKIVITNNVDTTKVGNYSVLFDVSDIALNKAPTITRTVNITNRPTIGGGSYSAPSSTIKEEIKPVIKKIKFDSKKAIDFIISQQNENGSFGESMYTDWATIALGSFENKDIKISSIIKLIKCIVESKEEGMFLTDMERHSMALMSLGLNPYDTNGKNYIKKIVESFDGKQFGDINQDNDDIFALIVLSNAGFSEKDKIINDNILFIISKQKENGSWNESIDMTSAVITSLSNYKENINVNEALQKAKDFLKEKQEDDGGWGNVSSTSWAIGGILGLDENPEDWIKNDNNPLDYLGAKQDIDGGIKNENKESKIWETSYAITASSLKTWNQIMQKFETPSPQNDIIKTLIIKTEKKEEITEKTPLKILKNKEVVDKKEIVKKITEPTINYEQREVLRKNWFMRFISKIFNF